MIRTWSYGIWILTDRLLILRQRLTFVAFNSIPKVDIIWLLARPTIVFTITICETWRPVWRYSKDTRKPSHMSNSYRGMKSFLPRPIHSSKFGTLKIRSACSLCEDTRMKRYNYYFYLRIYISFSLHFLPSMFLRNKYIYFNRSIFLIRDMFWIYRFMFSVLSWNYIA